MVDENQVQNPLTPNPSPTPKAGGEGNDTPLQGGLSQDDVNKLVGKARKEGKDVALKELLVELGFESPDALKGLVSEAKAKREAEMSEAQKLQSRLDALEGEKQAKDAELLSLKAQQVTERKAQSFLSVARASGVKSPDDLLILVTAKHGDKFNAVFDEAGSASDEKLKALLKEMQSAFPAFFGTQGAGSPSNAGAINPTNKTQATEQARADIRRKFGF